MKLYHRLAVLVSASLLPGTAAVAATIDFENLAVGTTLNSQYAGVSFVANAFTGPGSSTSGQAWATNTDMTIVSSTGTDVGGLGTPTLVSGNILRSFNGWLNENGDPSFSINFASAISAISITFAGVAVPADTCIFVYNGATLLGTVAGTITTGQFALSFTAPSITRVAVAPGSFNDWVGVDNIAYTPNAVASVPEPATWGLMLLGFGGMGLSMRRRTKVRTTVSFA